MRLKDKCTIKRNLINLIKKIFENIRIEMIAEY